ncbi:porin family protein [Hymenobacter caeli]|uniref:Outer membrane protein beta-barrel domain-containing protein n=1 Tax=Hymenobacter caeli TaxID=2735894 RepID=A0ABX2FUQ2_9BACT|nr:porin family protein [Hymenobacter caeli]NRT20214.1 hypothetical protein [Hymenobacter caeli]
MKHLLLLFSALYLTVEARAQNPAVHAPTHKISFGIKAGFNSSNTDFNRGIPAPAAPVETAWKPGFVTGFLLQVPIGKRLFLQPEYLYSLMGGKNNTSGTEYSFGYLSLPVLLKYSLTPRLEIMAGPQFDLLIRATQRVNGSSEDITHDTEERSVGATAGLEFYVMRNLSLAGRYLFGLNHIGIGQRSAVTEFEFESVQLTTNFRF